MIYFESKNPNQLLLNPKISDQEKNIIGELKNVFDDQMAGSGYFLIVSSGSSQKSNESVKLIALHVEKVLNSARRFIEYYKVNEKDHWGLVLPDYHVAGLGVRSRAFLSGARVFAQDWNADKLIGWIHENKIQYISMVPAQIFDLVKKNIKNITELKKIFVGGGALGGELLSRALDLNWPIVETYGMTETSSMIAVKEGESFEVLPGIEVKTDLDLLKIKCDSLLTAIIQKIDGQIQLNTFQENSWYATQDRVQLVKLNEVVKLKFLGRTTDYIKILGEGVSLSELRSQLSKLILFKKLEIPQFELLALEDSRAGYKLVLAVENTVNNVQANELIGLFNLACRPYEKILQCVVVGQIPRTELGKLKTEELKRIVSEELSKG